MRKEFIPKIVFQVLAFCFFCTILTPNSAYSGRQALVIGNGGYPNAVLKNPANDARDMSKVLKELGFTVDLVLNGTLGEMQEAIKQFAYDVSSDDVALFYYAGHALQFNSENYLLAIDTGEKVRALKLTDAMNDFNNADISIIIIDACRTDIDNEYYQTSNGVLTRAARGVGVRAQAGLAPPKRAMESFVAYSTDIGNVAEDGRGRNSTFTKYLLKYIQTPGIRFETVFKKVRESVSRETHGKQIPWDSSSITGDFYFVR